MKSFKNNNEFFLKTLHPNVREHRDNVNAFNMYSQKKFNSYIKKLGGEEIGEVSEKEIKVIEQIKNEIEILKKRQSKCKTDKIRI